MPVAPHPNVVITRDEPKKKAAPEPARPVPQNHDDLDKDTKEALASLGFIGREHQSPSPADDKQQDGEKPPGDDKQQDAGKPSETDDKGQDGEKQEKEPEKKRRKSPLVEATEKLADVAEKLSRPVPQPQQPQQQQPTPPPAVDDEEAEKIEALGLLERDRRYAGRNLQKEYKEFVEKFKAYRAAWEKENPKAKFDEEADDHDEWIEANSPDIDETDLTIARTRLASRREMAAMLANERYAGMRKAVDNAADEAAKVAPSELAGLIDEKYVGKKLDEIQADNPMAAMVLEHFQGQAAARARLATQLCHPDAAIQYNPMDERHVWAGNQLMEFERQLAEQPADRTVRFGKHFATAQQYFSLPENERGPYWTVYRAPDVVRFLMMVDLATQAKETLGRYSKIQTGRKGEPPPPPAAPAPGFKPPSSAAAGGAPSPLGESKGSAPDMKYFFGQ